MPAQKQNICDTSQCSKVISLEMTWHFRLVNYSMYVDKGLRMLKSVIADNIYSATFFNVTVSSVGWTESPILSFCFVFLRVSFVIKVHQKLDHFELFLLAHVIGDFSIIFPLSFLLYIDT